jgi:hypothetical protein
MIEVGGSEFLISSQNIDGGWGYAIGSQSFVEPTSAAILALLRSSASESAVERAVGWLLDTQHPDGGWGVGAADRVSGWTTAWAVLALQRARPDAADAEQGLKWLLEVEPWVPAGDETDQTVQTDFGIDFTLRGWPWRPNEASWVEPTALAMLALAPVIGEPGARARLNEATRYLVNRRCTPGGWNVGNPSMLGAQMPLRAHPTAWSLLALQRHAPEEIEAADTSALQAEMHRDGGTPALAWGVLALRSIGREDPDGVERLARSQSADGGWNTNPYHTAIALLALEGML